MAFIQAQANGTIYPCRFVSMDAQDTPGTTETYSFKVLEDIIVAQPILGVSQEGTTGFPMVSGNDMGVTAPTYAAAAGQMVKVFGPGEQCLVEIAGDVTAGNMLKANATTDGKAIAVAIAGSLSTPQHYGGIALQSGVSGEKIRMLVHPGVYTYAA